MKSIDERIKELRAKDPNGLYSNSELEQIAQQEELVDMVEDLHHRTNDPAKVGVYLYTDQHVRMIAEILLRMVQKGDGV